MTQHRSGPACLAATALLLTAGLADASSRDAVFGCWLAENGDSVLHVKAKGDGLVGEIAALDDPVYKPGDVEGMDGKPRLDDLNPDEAKRTMPLLGMEVLEDFQFDDGWEGKIYDPGSGKTYDATVAVEDGKLALHGYLGFSWLGRTVYYAKPETNPGTRDHLFEISSASGPCSGAPD